MKRETILLEDKEVTIPTQEDMDYYNKTTPYKYIHLGDTVRDKKTGTVGLIEYYHSPTNLSIQDKYGNVIHVDGNSVEIVKFGNIGLINQSHAMRDVMVNVDYNKFFTESELSKQPMKGQNARSNLDVTGEYITESTTYKKLFIAFRELKKDLLTNNKLYAQNLTYDLEYIIEQEKKYPDITKVMPSFFDEVENLKEKLSNSQKGFFDKKSQIDYLNQFETLMNKVEIAEKLIQESFDLQKENEKELLNSQKISLNEKIYYLESYPSTDYFNKVIKENGYEVTTIKHQDDKQPNVDINTNEAAVNEVKVTNDNSLESQVSNENENENIDLSPVKKSNIIIDKFKKISNYLIEKINESFKNKSTNINDDIKENNNNKFSIRDRINSIRNKVSTKKDQFTP